jgi:hypothetical protein
MHHLTKMWGRECSPMKMGRRSLQSPRGSCRLFFKGSRPWCESEATTRLDHPLMCLCLSKPVSLWGGWKDVLQPTSCRKESSPVYRPDTPRAFLTPIPYGGFGFSQNAPVQGFGGKTLYIRESRDPSSVLLCYLSLNDARRRQARSASGTIRTYEPAIEIFRAFLLLRGKARFS